MTDIEPRKNVAQLIRLVLIGKLCVREAINQFPQLRKSSSPSPACPAPAGQPATALSNTPLKRLAHVPYRESFSDIEDESIQAAYHALVHFEADEDLRNRDPLYKEEQDSYLMMIAEILESGEDLPFNIINSYKEFYKSANIPNGNDWKGKWKSFFKMLNV